MTSFNKRKVVAKLKKFEESFVGQKKDICYRGFLPHFDIGSRYQMITYRLNDSLPAEVLTYLREKESDNIEYRKKIEKLIDAGYGSCLLKEPAVAEMIIENWIFFDKKKYDLIAYVVMPNHVHVMIKMYLEAPLSKIIHSWKSYTSKKFNSVLKNENKDISDVKWEHDYWDRYIRDENHFVSAVDYIHNNPVKAGLCKLPEDWHYSSSLNPKK